jgi:hypothetical protein
VEPSEAPPAALLDGAALVYFDGRLTEAALGVAAAARDRGLPLLVEAERLRPGLEALLATADYVSTSAHFPQVRLVEPCKPQVQNVERGSLRLWSVMTAFRPSWGGGGSLGCMLALQSSQHCSGYSIRLG